MPAACALAYLTSVLLWDGYATRRGFLALGVQPLLPQSQ